MLYRKAQVSDRWLRAPLQAPTALHQPLSYISRSHIADVFASQENGRKDISVCFTGHRAIPPQELPALTERLDRVLEALYQHGFRDFICGGALGFDTLAAQRILLMRTHHADVRLRLAIPCSTQSARWKASDCLIYEQLLYAADETVVLSAATEGPHANRYGGCRCLSDRQRAACTPRSPCGGASAAEFGDCQRL
ncbi:MAG: SLOG family protein [Christensenellales bacterium]